MTIEQAFEIRKKLLTMKDRVEAMVLENILRGEYDRLENAKSIAEDDIRFINGNY
ncbi:hypothetical protein HPMBJEAJ_00131 [Aeromonas phage avDM6]|nr:hypothetical protein HPMBJEAJ_00131 [Aeromonas phage avDM6]